MTINIPKISYVQNPMYFQNSQLIGNMQISRKAEFSDFSEKHSDILQVLPYKNQKKSLEFFLENILKMILT